MKDKDLNGFFIFMAVVFVLAAIGVIFQFIIDHIIEILIIVGTAAAIALIIFIIVKIVEHKKYKKFEIEYKKQVEKQKPIKTKSNNQINEELTNQALEDIKNYSKIYTAYKEPIITKEDELYSEYLKEKRLNEEQEFYEKQIKKLSKCEKLYYDVLYNHYKDNYLIETQVYLRSMFPRMGAENHRIDIVFKDKQWEKPILLIEINDETHSRNPVTKMRDKDLKEFCKEHNIKLQALWTKFGVNKYSIIKLIDKRLKE